MRIKTVLVPPLMLSATLVITPLAAIMVASPRVHASCIESPKVGLTKEEANTLQQTQEISIAQADNQLSVEESVEEILAAHNKYREELGIASLTWSDELAQGAQEWADELKTIDGLEHSETNYGENLAGLRPENGDTFTTTIDERWGAEKQYFRNKRFPNISTTGDWWDVGHYSQMIWKNTKQVGCGYADREGTYDVLVCRYNPPGNYTGQKAY